MLVAGCAGPGARGGASGPLLIAEQGSFFVGGREVRSESLSTLPAYAPAGTIVVDQMYVRYQIPVGASRPPLTLIHGCCLTGKSWETTPDGRMGWDEYFVRQGHPTYVIDQVSRGRSAADPSAIIGVKSGKAAADQLPPVFSAEQGVRLGDLPLRARVSEGSPRNAVPARGAGRVLEADGSRLERDAADAEPDRAGAVVAGQAAAAAPCWSAIRSRASTRSRPRRGATKALRASSPSSRAPARPLAAT